MLLRIIQSQELVSLKEKIMNDRGRFFGAARLRSWYLTGGNPVW